MLLLVLVCINDGLVLSTLKQSLFLRDFSDNLDKQVDHNSKNTTDQRTKPKDPVIGSLTGDNRCSKRTSRINGGTINRSTDHVANEDSRTNNEGSEISQQMLVNNDE